MDNRKEWEELVAQANGSKVDGKFYNLDVSVIPIILWADARIRALEEAVEWALDKLELEPMQIVFREQHIRAVDGENCVCCNCDATAFAEMIRIKSGIRRRAGRRENAPKMP